GDGAHADAGARRRRRARTRERGGEVVAPRFRRRARAALALREPRHRAPRGVAGGHAGARAERERGDGGSGRALGRRRRVRRRVVRRRARRRPRRRRRDGRARPRLGARRVLVARLRRPPRASRRVGRGLDETSDERLCREERVRQTMSKPKTLVVVQRYGDGVAGGAEAHARQLVNRLKPHLDIEVLTTAASDYRTWENTFTAGIDWVDDVPVRRFPVLRQRAWDFKLYERRAFAPLHTLEDERTFVDAQGPYAPDLLEHLWRAGHDADHVLFFTYIYYPTVRGLPLVPERAVLVPTAHDEPALGLSIYEPVFHAPRAIAFNTEEERALVHARFRNERVPNDILGVGVEVPDDRSADRF